MINVNKIAIIGGPGTGKTTLANNLRNVFNIPVYSIDDIKFSKNWKIRNKKDVDNKINNIINKKRWIIEGNHLRNLNIILSKADLVVFLDFHLFLQLKGIFKRFFSNFHNCIKNMNNCKEKISFSFFIKTLTFNIKKRPKIIELLMENRKYELILLANYQQTETWLNTIKNEVS